MTDIRFPYDLTSREALVELIRRDRPHDWIVDENLTFGDMFSSPTDDEPGRTFIEMTNRGTGKKRWLSYRRLDIELVLREYTPAQQSHVNITLSGAITSAKILAEINRVFNMHLDHEDVSVNDQRLTNGLDVVYTLQIIPTSLAYYGYVPIYVNTTPYQLGYRLLEDGEERLLENGQPRRLES